MMDLDPRYKPVLIMAFAIAVVEIVLISDRLHVVFAGISNAFSFLTVNS